MKNFWEDYFKGQKQKQFDFAEELIKRDEKNIQTAEYIHKLKELSVKHPKFKRFLTMKINAQLERIK